MKQAVLAILARLVVRPASFVQAETGILRTIVRGWPMIIIKDLVVRMKSSIHLCQKSLTLVLFFGLLASCAPPPSAPTPEPQYTNGLSTKSLDPSVSGPVSGLGIEAQDIIAMTDEMMRDMLLNPQLSARPTPPRVIIDDAYFRNESSQPLNRKLIVNKLRINLSRAAHGRMRFIGREFSDAVERERTLKREGVTDVGTTGLTKAQSGADYRLTGTIAALDSSSRAGLEQRYTQITFEMIDLETGELVWSNAYEISRAAADDVLYR